MDRKWRQSFSYLVIARKVLLLLWETGSLHVLYYKKRVDWTCTKKWLDKLFFPCLCALLVVFSPFIFYDYIKDRLSGVCTIQNAQKPPVQLCIVHFAFSDTRQSILHIIIKDTKRFENKFWKTRTFGLCIYHSIAEQNKFASYLIFLFIFIFYCIDSRYQFNIGYVIDTLNIYLSILSSHIFPFIYICISILSFYLKHIIHTSYYTNNICINLWISRDYIIMSIIIYVCISVYPSVYLSKCKKHLSSTFLSIYLSI